MKTTKVMKRVLLGALVMVGLSIGGTYVNPTWVSADEEQTMISNDEAKSGDSTEFLGPETKINFKWEFKNGVLTIKQGATFVYDDNVDSVYNLEYFFTRFQILNTREIKKIVFEDSKISGNAIGFLSRFLGVTEIDLSKLDVSGLTSAQSWFTRDRRLTTIDLSNPTWQRAKITSFWETFQETAISNVKGLEMVNLKDATATTAMFLATWTDTPYNFTHKIAEQIKNWDVSNVQMFNQMFWAWDAGEFDPHATTPMLWLDISNWKMTPSSNLYTAHMLRNIQQITLGKDNNFQSTDQLNHPTIDEASTFPGRQFTYYLDENTIITVPLTGTGLWQFVADGNPLYPAGGTLTNQEIDAQYQIGVPHPQEPRTFVFEHNTNLNLNVDESDAKLTAGQTFDPKTRFKSLTAPGDASTVITPNRPLTYDEAVKLGLKITGADKIDYEKGGTFPITYNFHDKNATVKVIVPAKQHPSTPNNSGGSTTPTTPPASSSTPATSSVTPPAPDNKPATKNQKQADPLEIPKYAAKKKQAVYAINPIYLYKHANFNKHQRLVAYPKEKRINRPMFVVIDYARSNNGALRYKVRDVNHTKKSDGKVGYITANWKYVRPVYYRSMPKNNRITVINPRGVHAYKNKNLTGRVHTYKLNKHLTVKKLVKHNLTTRYQLSNGYYVTANKKLVIQGTY